MNKQIADELNKPLVSTNVKQREQGGIKLSYIESWHAIAEANRIFGWDGWTRQTQDLQLVQAEQKGDKGLWYVSYLAKSLVTVHGVAREGMGFGQGIDRDLGKAHESAVKEAESDAMKRALMTFGNPFGLALYDKTQANVVKEMTKEEAEKVFRDAIAIKWKNMGGKPSQFKQLMTSLQEAGHTVDAYTFVDHALQEGCETIEQIYHYAMSVKPKLANPFTLG
jgi:DNA repair and recombination protein RAD52